jgi:hypothetical protein
MIRPLHPLQEDKRAVRSTIYVELSSWKVPPEEIGKVGVTAVPTSSISAIGGNSQVFLQKIVSRRLQSDCYVISTFVAKFF